MRCWVTVAGDTLSSAARVIRRSPVSASNRRCQPRDIAAEFALVDAAVRFERDDVGAEDAGNFHGVEKMFLAAGFTAGVGNQVGVSSVPDPVD